MNSLMSFEIDNLREIYQIFGAVAFIDDGQDAFTQQGDRHCSVGVVLTIKMRVTFVALPSRTLVAG